MKLNNSKKKRTIIIIIVSAIVGVLLIGAVAIMIAFPSISTENKNPEELIGISLSSLPDKRVYYIGEEFDPQGVSIQTVTNDTTYSRFVYHEQLGFSGFDSAVANEA